MSVPPVVHFVPEIIEQCFGGGEMVGQLFPCHMFVIAFAGLVIVTEHATIARDKCQPVFVVMAAPWLGGRQTPHDQFNEGVLRKKAAFVQEQLGFLLDRITTAADVVNVKRNGVA
jgi:hypothetical protein